MMKKIRPIDGLKKLGERGYALFAVTTFVFVLIVGSMTLFSTSNSETKMVIHDQHRTEAFYLADAAVERAKARLSLDPDWRDGWTNVSLGNGTYSLTVADSMVGTAEGLAFIAEGVVGREHERLLLLGELRATGDSIAMLAGDEFEANHNFTVVPRLHVNGEYDLGSGDQYLHGGELTTEPFVPPVTMHTEPSYWPDATYYDVRGSLDGGTPHAVIYDAAGNDITATVGTDLAGVMSYDSGSSTFSYSFSGNGVPESYFDESSGVFSLESGDSYVVVNFGNTAVTDPPGFQTQSDVFIRGTGHTVLTPTIINTRFVGSTVEQRIEPEYWIGGDTAFRVLSWEPTSGVAVVAHEFEFDTGHAWIGSEDSPALVFATDSIETGNGHPRLNGAMSSLGEIEINSQFTGTYDPDFFSVAPGFIQTTWPGNADPELWILSWQQMSVSTN